MNKIKTSKKRPSRVKVGNLETSIDEMFEKEADREEYCEKVFNYLLDEKGVNQKLKNKYLYAKSKYVAGVWYDNEHSYLCQCIADEYNYDELTIYIHDLKHLDDFVACAKVVSKNLRNFTNMYKDNKKAVIEHMRGKRNEVE